VKGQLLCWDATAGRRDVRCEDSGAGIRAKQANITLGTDFTLDVAADGSTPVRVARDQAAAKVGGGRYLPSQFSLWLGSQRLEEDRFDSQNVVINRCLSDYGIRRIPGVEASTFVLDVQLAARPVGMPAELDPTSEYSKVREFPERMAYEEKVRRHKELFGKHGRYEGPPHHPDVQPAGAFSMRVGHQPA
jgi:hypothetical protein